MRKAFTMVEIIFVMVIIGIISAIAIPNMSSTVNLANNNNGLSTLAIVKAAIDTERNKRILRADFTPMTSLSSNGKPFDYFSPDNNGVKHPLLKYPIPSCNNSGCWELLDSASFINGDETYLYHYNEGEICSFIFKNNKLSGDCPILKSYM